MSYRIQEDGDGFRVFQTQPRTVTSLTSDNGTLHAEVKTYQAMFKIGCDPSIFDAWYEGDGWWTIDLDCGAQRWYGKKPTREVRKALRNCGFDTKTINNLFTKYTKEKDA